jgi:hypothetical protein
MSSAVDTVYWIGRAKLDESTGRKLYRGFHLNGCKYERGDCVYLAAPPDPKLGGCIKINMKRFILIILI